MKRVLSITLLLLGLSATAQYRGEGSDQSGKGFQKNKLFTGGAVNLGFSSYSTNFGIAPQLGISLTDWLDAGINVNINYTSERDPYSPEKWHQTNFGPGVFVRIFPVSMLFATVQYEYNFINTKYFPGNNSPTQKQNVQAPSLLLGLGYAGGRMKGSNTYYYFSVSGDFLGRKYSPYIDQYDRMMPVVRAGYNIGLFQGKGRSRY